MLIPVDFVLKQAAGSLQQIKGQKKQVDYPKGGVCGDLGS